MTITIPVSFIAHMKTFYPHEYGALRMRASLNELEN